MTVDVQLIAAQVSRLTLGPDDYAIIRMPVSKMRPEFAEHLRAAFKDHPARGRIIVMRDDMSIEKMSRAEIEALLA